MNQAELLDAANLIRDEHVETFRTLMDAIQLVMAIKSLNKAWTAQWTHLQPSPQVLAANFARKDQLLDIWEADFQDPNVRMEDILDDIGDRFPTGNIINIP